MFGFCYHQWDNPKDGYQSCKKCNKRVSVKCSHRWEVYREAAMVYPARNFMECDRPVSFTRYHLQCKKCGTFCFKNSNE